VRRQHQSDDSFDAGCDELGGSVLDKRVGMLHPHRDVHVGVTRGDERCV
jgi:hypothetical protein